jgi:DNA-dependent RNA polymerase auxiliary subunit epsilon
VQVQDCQNFTKLPILNVLKMYYSIKFITPLDSAVIDREGEKGKQFKRDIKNLMAK